MAKNLRQHTLDVFQNIVIPEPHNAKSASLKQCRSRDVVFHTSGVLTTVDFYHQSSFYTHEVYDVPADRELSTKLQPAQLSSAQTIPEETLGIRRRASE